MILEKIYGQEPIQLKMMVYGSSEGIPHEVTETNLMALGSKYDLLMKDTNPQIPDKIRSAVRIRAVPLEGYRSMTTFVNGVYLNSDLRTIVTSLASSAGMKLNYDTSNENKRKYDQIIVPPAPLYNALQYLDRTFGFFDGLAGIYSTSVKTARSSSTVTANIKPELYIKNLTHGSKSSDVTITQFSTDNPDQEKLFDVFDAKTFYTYNPVETEYSGNTIFSMYGSKMRHVVKPRNELYHVIDLDTNDFANSYGIVTKKDQVFFSKKGQENRISFFKDHTGYDNTETHIRAIYSKFFAQMSLLKITLEKWLMLENLLKVGISVKFNSGIQDVRDVTGIYVSKFSMIHFLRAKRDWECEVTLHLIRTNRIT
jgi:hypothetical protein